MTTAQLVMLIPVIALATGFVAVLRMPKRAFGHRADPELETRVDELEQALDTIRQQLIETQERLDFAERLLARPEGARQLGK